MINIEGFAPAYKHGVLMKNGDAQIYTDEFGNILKVTKPAIAPISRDKKYPQFSFKMVGQTINHMVHHVVASTFLGSRNDWITNGSPPPVALTNAEGKRKANELWKQTPAEVKIAIAGSAVDIDHKNDNREDYRLENLQYMYSAENKAKTPGGARKRK